MTNVTLTSLILVHIFLVEALVLSPPMTIFGNIFIRKVKMPKLDENYRPHRENA